MSNAKSAYISMCRSHPRMFVQADLSVFVLFVILYVDRRLITAAG